MESLKPITAAEVSAELTKQQRAQDELDTLKRDLKTAGRIFKLMTDEDE